MRKSLLNSATVFGNIRNIQKKDKKIITNSGQQLNREIAPSLVLQITCENII